MYAWKEKSAVRGRLHGKFLRFRMLQKTKSQKFFWISSFRTRSLSVITLYQIHDHYCKRQNESDIQISRIRDESANFCSSVNLVSEESLGQLCFKVWNHRPITITILQSILCLGHLHISCPQDMKSSCTWPCVILISVTVAEPRNSSIHLEDSWVIRFRRTLMFTCLWRCS